MPYVAKIVPWGDGAALPLTANTLKESCLKIGAQVEIEITEQGILVKARRKRPTLDDMIAACDPDAPMPTDMATWEQGSAEGKELLCGRSA